MSESIVTYSKRFFQPVLINSEHCRAICEEIGDRLRCSLAAKPLELPLHLSSLLDKLFEQEYACAPSIAPTISEMTKVSLHVPEEKKLGRILGPINGPSRVIRPDSLRET